MEAKITEVPTITFMNTNFVIRYREPGAKKWELIGAGRYHLLVGEDKRDKHFLRAVNYPEKKCPINVYKKYEIIFHGK